LQRYLDYNATCPPVQASLEAVTRVAKEASGNPSSLHWAGRAARRVIDDARDRLAAFIGAEAGSVVFTSGCTEADNIAINSVLSSTQPGRVITTAIEHPAILQSLDQYVSEQAKADGWELIKLRPGSDGFVRAEDMIEAITADTRLVCMMLVNNESGVIQPVQQVADYCRNMGVPMLVDAAQALGKTAVDFQKLGVDFMGLSAHKIGGPKGVGALLVRRGVRLRELTPGGGQERGRRSGTENVPGIAGFAAALGEIDFTRLAPIRDAFEEQLKAAIPDMNNVSENVERAANTSLVVLPGMDGETLLMQLDLAGFAIASGSACSSGKSEPSHVLMAMGLSAHMARSAIRVSFGPANTLDDAKALVDALVAVRKRLRNMAGITL
jgi:cysteine desulfurase